MFSTIEKSQEGDDQDEAVVVTCIDPGGGMSFLALHTHPFQHRTHPRALLSPFCLRVEYDLVLQHSLIEYLEDDARISVQFRR